MQMTLCGANERRVQDQEVPPMSVRTATIRTLATAATAGVVATLFTASSAFAAIAPANTTTVEAPAPLAAAPAKAQQGQDKRRYCALIEITGSRVAHRICKTRAEWAARGLDVDHPNG
ncbi:MAG: hypothetical protein BVN32_02705 [Proteobacteria bacterium ST_bin14]|nr:MAG: hypothetical protein BVN32_02705 [Proteobacteria bacterium ST_bin14]